MAKIPEEAKPFSFELSDGTKVVFGKMNGNDLIKARKMAGKDQMLAPYYLMSEGATFDGKKLLKDEILALCIADVLYLEDKWNEFADPKNSQVSEA